MNNAGYGMDGCVVVSLLGVDIGMSVRRSRRKERDMERILVATQALGPCKQCGGQCKKTCWRRWKARSGLAMTKLISRAGSAVLREGESKAKKDRSWCEVVTIQSSSREALALRNCQRVVQGLSTFLSLTRCAETVRQSRIDLAH